MYDYEAETFNGVNGASDLKSGPKVSCKVCLTTLIINVVTPNRKSKLNLFQSALQVEIDVPQTCSFILRTTECSLTEISGMDEGTPVYNPAAGAEAFKAAMAK